MTKDSLERSPLGLEDPVPQSDMLTLYVAHLRVSTVSLLKRCLESNKPSEGEPDFLHALNIFACIQNRAALTAVRLSLCESEPFCLSKSVPYTACNLQPMRRRREMLLQASSVPARSDFRSDFAQLYCSKGYRRQRSVSSACTAYRNPGPQLVKVFR